MYAEALAGIDLVAGPTCPIVACRFEEIGTAVVTSAPLLTTQWNGLGMPAISVPMGMLDAPGANNGLPVGLQLASARVRMPWCSARRTHTSVEPDGTPSRRSASADRPARLRAAGRRGAARAFQDCGCDPSRMPSSPARLRCR